MVSKDLPRKQNLNRSMNVLELTAINLFSKHLFSSVDVNLEVIGDLNHVCGSEIKDLEPSKTYFFHLWIRESTSRIVQLMKMGVGEYFRWNTLCATLFVMEKRSRISFSCSPRRIWIKAQWYNYYFLCVEKNSLPCWDDMAAFVLKGHYRLYIVLPVLRYFMIICVIEA